jgi:GEVED domain/PKD-like domain
MKQFFTNNLLRMTLLLATMVVGAGSAWAQVSVTASAGTVGPTVYTTVNAAFTAINAGTHQGAIVINVTANTTEPATPIPLLKSGAPSVYTSILIKPTGNVTINSAAAPVTNRSILELAGADNVTIDGDDLGTAGAQNLSIVAAPVATAGIGCVRLSSNSTLGADGADNNTVKNCIITGARASAVSTVTSYGIHFSNGVTTSTATAGAYSNLNTLIQNNIVTRCYYGITFYGPSITYPNTGTRILNNTVGNAVSANNIGFRGIVGTNSAAVAGATSVLIESNDVRVGDYGATGYTASVAGIELGTGNAGAKIHENNIHDINQPNTGGYGAHGIYITGISAGPIITNNFIRDCKMNVYQVSFTSTFTPNGIFFTSGATGVVLNNNTIVMNAQLGAGVNFTSTGINSSVSTVTFAQILNNIVVNNAASTNAYAINVLTATSILAAAVNNNNYYVPSGNVGSYVGVVQTLFATWKTNTGKDAAGLNLNPIFVSPTDLHLNYGVTPTQLESGGVAVATTNVPVDIDGQTRPGPTGSVNGGATNPDIGADEFDGAPLTPPSVTTLTITPSATGCVNVSRAITAVIAKGSNNITAVTLSYSVNGGAAVNVAMTGWTATGTSTATATIPTITPSNGTVTWSVNATDGGLTTTLAGATYKDEPLTGFAFTATATPTAMCAGGTATLTATPVISAAPTYALPPAVGNPTSDEDFGNITITQGATTILNNTTTGGSLTGTIGTATGTAGSYADFTAFGPYTLNPNGTYNLSVSSITQGGSFGNAMAVFIDYNRNGVFTDAGEAVYNQGATISGPHTSTATFVVPASVAFGQTRMRVLVNEGTISGPAITPTWGEYEEYAIFLAPTFTYAWSNGVNTATGNPTTSVVTSVPATYSVTATDITSGCTVTAAAAVITSAPALSAASIINAGASAVCIGGTFTFGATTTGGCPNFTYKLYESVGGTPTLLQTQTNVSTSTATFTALTPTAGAHNYYVEVTDNIGTTATAVQTTVTVNALPVPTITGGNTCYAGSAVQLVATPAGMTDYTWQPTFGGGLSDPFIQNPLASPLASTTYTVQVTDANGCTGTATTRIDFAVTLTPQNISVCPGNASLPIGVTGTCATNTATLTLPISNAVASTTEGTSDATAVTITTITMPALPAGATITSGTITVNGIALGTGSYGSEIRVRLTGAIAEAAGVAGATTTTTPNPVNYTRAITPANVNTAGGVITLGYWDSVNDAVVPDAAFPAGANIGSIVINYTYPAAINWFTAATGGASIATGNTMDPVATAGSGLTNTNTLGTTTYYAGCSNAPNCRQAVTFTVASAVLGAATVTSSVPAVCPTGTFTFTGGITGGCSPYTYKLFEQGNASALQTKTAISSITTAFTAIAPTVGVHTYYVEVTDASGATATAPSLVVTVNPYPTVTAAPAASCYSTAAVALTAAGASTYAWSPAAGLSATTGTSTNASPAQSTTYMVTGTDVNGCTATAMVQVDKMPFTTANNGVVCQGSTAPLLSVAGTCPNTTGTITLTFPTAGITVPDVGSNSTIATFTMPALPAGAVATSIVLTANNTTTNPGSTGVWQSDLQLGLSGAATAALGTGAGSTSIAAQNAPGWNYIRTTTPGAVSAAGGVVNLIYSSFNSAGQDHFFPNGVTAVISYSAPASQEWFTAATGGAAFATGTSVQIVGTAALANTNTAGTTTVYTGCTNAVNCRFPVTLTVNEAATVNAGVDKSTCEDAAPTAIVLGDAVINIPAATGTWSIVAGGTVVGTLSSTAAEAVPSTVTFTPTANDYGTVTLRLTTADPDGAGPCVAATDDVLITVYQKPILVLTGTTGCVAGGVDLNTFINAAGSTFPATAAGTSFNFFEADMITPVADPSLVSTAGTYYIQAVSDAANGSCVSLLMPVTLTDGPVFTLTALAAAARPCIGTPVTLNASPILTETPAVGETITYTVEDPANVITNAVTLAGAPYIITQCPAPSPALGVYTFTATSSLTGCSSVNQVTMTFKQTPVLTTTAPAAVCFPSTINITTPAVRLAVNSPVSPSSAITYSYYATAAAAAAGTPVITPAAAGVLAAPSNPGNTPYTATYYVRAQLANGCKDIDPVAITINGTPVGTVLTGNAQTVCGGTTPTFSGMTFGTTNAMPATTFTWTRDKTTQVTGLAAAGSGNIAAATLVNTTTTPQTVTFTITPLNSATTPACTGTAFTATLIVNPDVAAPSAVTPFALCAGTTPAVGAGVKASCGGGNIVVNFAGPINPTGNGTSGAPLTIATAAFPGIPTGAVITSVTLVSNGVTVVTGSWASECRLGLSGAITNAAIAGSTLTSVTSFNYTRAITGLTAPIAAGTLNLLFFDSFPDATVDNTFPSGVQLNIAYDFPSTISYYASATGADLLGTAVSTTGYNPIGVTAAGAAAPLVANNTTSGVYTLYAACPGCGTNRTPVTFTINALPAAAISPASPVNVCVGGSQTFTASGGTGYVWSNSFGTTPAITLNFNLVSTGNIFTVTVTDANACTNTATTLVNINALPTPNITSSGGTLVCAGTPLTLNAGVAGATYVWNTGGSMQTITDSPIANTTYTVTITNPAALGGCTATGSITIQVVAAPTIASLTATPATFCGSGSSNLLATASTTPAIINSTFAGAGCIINASGISAPHPVALNVSGLPTTGVTVKSVTLNGITHTFGSDVDIFLRSPNAQDVIIMTDAGSIAGLSVPTTLTFQDGSPLLTTTSAPIPTGTYGCSNLTSYSGTTPAPVGTATTLSTFTGNPNGTWNLYVFDDLGGDGGSLGSFSITFNVPNNLTYTWTGGLSTTNAATTPIITTTTPYTVTVTNIAGCTATRSVTVTVNPLPMPTIMGTPAFCVGGNTTLTATGGTSYLWSNGVVVAANTISAISTYTVTVTDGNGCTASTTVSVTQNALPVATLTKSSNLTCAVTTVTLTAATGTMFNFGTGFTATPTFDVTAAGTYMVTVQNAAGCTATASIGVTANTTPPVANVMGNLFFCTGASTILSASPGFATYVWSGGTASTATNKRVFNTAGTFSVVITGTNGCSTTKTFVLVENTKPVVGAVTMAPTCQGSPLTGAVTVTSVLPATTTWTASGFTATGLSITRSPATTAMSGLYIIRAANSCGTTTTSTTAVVKASVPVTVAINNASTLGGSTGSINVTVPAGCSISWADNAGITVGSRNGLAAGVYTVTVTPPVGSPYCPVTRAIQVN